MSFKGNPVKQTDRVKITGHPVHTGNFEVCGFTAIEEGKEEFEKKDL